jgi:glycogen(starch) synthase
MRILYWTPQFWPETGGIEVLAMNTLPALSERGYQFLVVASHGRSEQPDSAVYKGIPIRRFPFWTTLSKNDVSLTLNLQKRIVELKRTFQPDLIHINFSGYTAFFQQATAKAYPAPTLVSLHSDLTGLDLGPATILGRLFHVADWVTAVSNATLTQAQQVIPEIAGRSSMIPGCVGPCDLPPSPLPFDKPCIVGIGRLVHEKGFDVLLDAIPAVADRFPDLSVRLIGDGPERFSLEQRTIGLGLKERIEFLGSIPNDDIPRHINGATLVVIPSRYQEAFGIVALEAGWMTRPVVATCVGGLAEIVVNEETGLLVEMENSWALAEAIIRLLSQPEKAEQMGRAARSRIAQEFSLTNYVQAYDNLYHRLATDHSRRLTHPEDEPSNS